MSLRARLVLALGALLTLGLAAFGFATYERYATGERSRVDQQLRASVAGVYRAIQGRSGGIATPGSAPASSTPPADSTGSMDGSGTGPNPPRDDDDDVHGPQLAGLYGVVRSSDGAILGSTDAYSGDDAPDLPTGLAAGTYFDAGSTNGGTTRWRGYVGTSNGRTVIVARPVSDTDQSLRKLVLIETIAGLGLLALLTSGAWLILRRGLRPLEHMATQARNISAGDLSHRVDVGDSHDEVGQLGVALNGMLDDLQQSFDAQQETEAKLRQFLADAAHELRTPLTSIRGFAELYRLQPAARVDADALMSRIESESLRMKGLVDDLLLLARLDRTAPAERGQVDLAVVAADACTSGKAIEIGRPISLHAPGPVVVEGVGDHLRQAVGNLVANAVQHTPAGSPIEVRVVRDAHRAVLTVRDHGAGLNPDALAHAFDRFWQADPARVGAGSGLGLSIVAGIATEHHGTVTAANAPDGGAIFTLTLPIG